jgi:hypothetical protein
MQTKVHLIGRDIFTDSWQVVALQGVQEYKKAQNLIIGSPFCLIQTRIIFNILCQIDFFRYPEVIHGLAIPVAYPFIPHIIEIIQICCISANHFSKAGFSIARRIE